MLEPLLVQALEEPFWIPTSQPEVQAAVLFSKEGLLVLPIWMGPGTQYVVPQGAVSELTITIPSVPKGCGVWEVRPGHVRSLRWERVHGGVKVFVPEFSLTGAIVLTDSHVGPKSLVVRFQTLQNRCAGRRSGPATWRARK